MTTCEPAMNTLVNSSFSVDAVTSLKSKTPGALHEASYKEELKQRLLNSSPPHYQLSQLMPTQSIGQINSAANFKCLQRTRPFHAIGF